MSKPQRIKEEKLLPNKQLSIHKVIEYNKSFIKKKLSMICLQVKKKKEKNWSLSMFIG